MKTYLLFLVVVSLFYSIYYVNVKPVKVVEKIGNSGDKFQASSNPMFLIGSVSMVLYFVIIFLYEIVVVPSESMMPNYSVGQRLVIDKKGFGLRNPIDNAALSLAREPMRGEAVIMQFPLNPQILYLKRVIALPGDRISLNEEFLTINNDSYPLSQLSNAKYIIRDVEKDYKRYQVSLNAQTWTYMVDAEKQFPNIEAVYIPKEGYYLIGDNLTASSDSRNFGSVPKSYFVATIL